MAVVAGFWGDVPLVGRERELGVLRAVGAGARDGRPGAVLVAGEAGGGKSRLVHALLEDLSPSALVFRAQCVDLGDPGLPCLAMIDLVRGVEAVAGADLDVAAVLDRLPVVASLSNSNASRDGTMHDSRRLQLFDATAALLAGVGNVRGLVVVTVEDLQWVDSSSSDFLRFLLSRLTSEQLLVVATVRTAGLSARPRLRQLLSDLSRLPSVHRLDLEPFNPSEVSEYLAHVQGSATDPGVAAEVFRRTGGNPYYVQTLAASVVRTGRVDPMVPRELADLLVGRLDGLPENARMVVRRAAVVGHPVSDTLLRAVVGLTDSEMDEALRVVVAEGVLKPDGAGFSFAHDLFRGAVYDDLLPGQRARLHATHAAVLESGMAGPVPAAEVAFHFAEARDSPKLMVWSIRAAEEAMQVLAPAEALQHLERALLEWPNVDDPSSLAGLSYGRVAVRAARAASLAGESQRAVDWAGRAIQFCDGERDGPGGVQARAELARQLVALDATDQMVEPAEEAVRLAESAGVDANSLALAHVVLARALLSARRLDEAGAQAGRALAKARGAGAAGLEVEALTTAALIDEINGDREAAADRLGTALRLARGGGELAAELRAHYSLACLHYYNGDVSGSLPVLRAAMTRVTETGLRWSDSGVELRLLFAVALYVSGDLGASLQAAGAPESQPPDVAAARLAAVGCYAAVAGGLADAERRLAELRGSWDADPQVALVAGGCEADRLAWLEEFNAAVAIAGRAQTHLDRVAGQDMYGGLWLSALALAALADEAARCRVRREVAGVTAAIRQGEGLMQRVERIVKGGHGRPGALGPEGDAWHARVVAENARLRGEAAVEQWQQAVEAFAYGHVYEQARCHWRLAEALIAVGDRDAARKHLRAASVSAERMGAVPLQRVIAATETGARLAGSAGIGGSVLTGREHEVLALVAEGLTNSEIGTRLFISAKTASVHLSNVMAKLNASSRTEAVTVAQRRGLLDVIGSSRPPR